MKALIIKGLGVVALAFLLCQAPQANQPDTDFGISKAAVTSLLAETAKKPIGEIVFSSDCGTRYSGSYSGSGFYIYPDETIDLSCLSSGTTVSIRCYSDNVPNRFNVYDGGSLLVSSGWMGNTSNPGPWGMSLSGPITKTISFTRGSSSTYTLRVETVAPSSTNDFWDATVLCSC